VNDARPDVTVGIVSWNAADDLRRCLGAMPVGLAGVRAQIVVVDNGSTDDTPAVLDAHPEVEAIRNLANVGLTPGRNQIVDRVRGRHVLMLDADTQLLPGSAATLTRYLDEHPHVGLVGAKLLERDGSLQLSCRTFPSPWLPFMRRPPLSRIFERRRAVNRHLMREYDHARPRAVDWVMGACQCYRAELLPVLGPYDERIFSHGGEDTDWCVRVWKAGSEVHYVPDAKVVHAYGHFTRRRPLSKQAIRGLLDYFYMQAKHRDARSGFAPAP
jgi:N-acetylglucosaminyl-diphospho-decaprenol L-rhamnosyltransferase